MKPETGNRKRTWDHELSAHGLMFFFDFRKAVRSSPGTVCRCKNCLVGEWSGSCSAKGGQRLIQSAVIQEAEHEHCIRKILPFIGAFCRRYIPEPGKDAQRLVIIFRGNPLQADMEGEKEPSRFLTDALFPEGEKARLFLS